MVVRACHNAEYIHNDISPSDVLLHFDEKKANTAYIGICDWSLSNRVVELAPSKYNYETLDALKKVRRHCPFAAPKLYFLYGKPGSTNAYKVEN